MTIFTRRGTGVTTTGTTWTTTANAYDGAAGTTPGTYAVWTSTVSGATARIEITGYGFDSVLTGSEYLASVTLTIRHRESNTTNIASVNVQPFDGATAIGAPLTLAKATTARTDTATWAVTMAQLRSATFKVRVNATRYAGTAAGTFSLDYVDVTADAPVKLATLTEDFTGPVDTAKWGTYGTAVFESGQAKLTSIQAYSGYFTVNKWDFSESSVFAKVTPPPAATSRETGMTVTNAGAGGATFSVVGATHTLMFRRKQAGNTDSYLGYDPVAHAWLRMRHSAGTLYWDTSPDGITWTNQYSIATTEDLRSVQFEISCGQWAAEADTQPGYFDNVNVPGVAGGRPKVWNGSAWVTKPVKVWTGSAWVEKPMKRWNGSAWVLV